jgi:hypothetical protein
MKTIKLTLIISIISISSLLYSQSSIIYETGTNLHVEIGADLCSDSITFNGTYSGGGTFCDGSLPVELISFTSSISMKEREVTLIWKTEKEINNRGFEIERAEVRSEKFEFRKIGYRQGKGTVSTPTNYTFVDRKLQTGKYKYRLKQIDYNGNFQYFSLKGDIEISLPRKFDLSQNYPNPFNPKTKIEFELPIDCKVTIKIYDIAGREIIVILNNEFRLANYYSVDFNGINFSSGVYFYRLTTDNFSETKKMIMVK